jgi:hypothetical protein
VGRAREVALDWGAEPLWSTRAPLSVFDGDTVHVVAGFAPGAEAAPRLEFVVDGGEVRHVLAARVEAAQGGAAAIAPDAAAVAPADSLAAVLPRVAAARRIVDATSRNGMRGALEAWATELAVRHQIVTNATNLFLVHRRAGADKASGLPTLQQVEQMLAAGWGGTGTVRVDAMAARSVSPECFRADEPPALMRSARTPQYRSQSVPAPQAEPPSLRERIVGRVLGERGVPAFLRHRGDTVRTTPRRLLAGVRAAWAAHDDLGALLRRLEEAPLPDGVREALREIEAQGAPREEAWLLVLGWLARHFGDATLPGEAAVHALDAAVGAMTTVRREAAERVLARRFAGATLEAW